VIIKVVVEIEAPDGATHYEGNLASEYVAWWKCKQIGAGGDHWFIWIREKGWVLGRHSAPPGLKEIPK